MKVVRTGTKQYEKLLKRDFAVKKRVTKTVARILEDVRANGDDAIRKYTAKFDHVKLKARDLKVTQSELSGAYQDIKPEIITTLRMVMDNINKFYVRNLRKSWKKKAQDDVLLGEKVTAVDSVGIYIPSGTVPLVSSVYMTVLPAKMAGVKRIVMTCPPNVSGYIDPHILVMADLLDVSEIYKVGGAQAIGALAFGTKTIPRVNKIVGPGNEYVTEAKRQVFGYCDIDMLAGPSEVLVLANHHSDPDFVIKDLQAQEEHHRGLPILVTPSKRLANMVKGEVQSGFIILTRTIDEAIEVSNQIAPEHLEIMLKNPKNALKKIRNAGAIFIGPYTPVTVGDYVAGPSHVLPTGGTAKFFSGLCVESFMKKSHIISYSKKALLEMRESIKTLTGIEKLPKHMEALEIRFSK